MDFGRSRHRSDMPRSPLTSGSLLSRPGPRLVAIVSLSAALLLVVAVVLIGRELRESIAGEARVGAEQTAEVFTRLTLEEEEYSADGITEEGLEDLEYNLGRSDALVGVTLWAPGGAVTASMGQTPARSRGYAASPAMASAFAGETQSEVVRGRSGAELLSVYVPVVLPGSDRPAGVLQTNHAYAPVRAEIAQRSRRLYMILGVAALLLYLALLPTVLRAARAMTRTYEARHVRLQRELRRAMRRGELELHYQPKISLGDGSVRGVEALLRWRHPEHGMIPPLDYLPAAETTPVIGPLTAHVMQLACEQLSRWRREGVDVNVALNLSSANLVDESLPPQFAAIVREAQVEAQWLTLEVTETAVMERSVIAGGVLATLQGMGFRVSMDDFGTGYSSLARLHDLPIDELKIDRSFITAIERHGDPRMLAAVVHMARELDLSCVAEGIETADIAERLAAMGCDAGQGYHWTRPLPAAELGPWLRPSLVAHAA